MNLTFSLPLTLACLSFTTITPAAAESLSPPPMQDDTCGTVCNYDFWQYSSMQVIRDTLADMPDLNVHGGYGSTPLHFAAAMGYVDIVRSLLAVGANPDVMNQYDATPLMDALNHESAATVQAFIDAGVSLDYGSPLGYVLKSCACMNSAEQVHMLIEGGADIAAADMYGDHPLYLAAGYSGPVELLAILAARSEAQLADHAGFLDAQNWREHTALTIAARWGNTKNVGILLESGANTTLTDVFGNSALHLAARWGTPELVEMLLKAGLDPRAKNREGQSPFFFAQDNGRLDDSNALIALQLLEITP